MKAIKLLITVVICFACSNATAATFKSIVGDDVKNYLNNSPKAADYPNAGAIALLNYDHQEMFEDGTSVIKQLERYKIFNERGYMYASNSIQYREGYQEVKIIFANTITPDGTIVPLETKDIRDFSPYASYELYTDIKQKRFTMPAIEPGSIVEYAYEIRNLKPVLPYDLYSQFFCQHTIPLQEDVLEIVVPNKWEIKYKMFRTQIVPFIEDVGDKKRYTFNNLSQPEIIREPRMPSIADREVFPQFNTWTLNNWETISNWYIKLLREQMQSDEELESFTKALIKDKKTIGEKIRELFHFVSQKVRYVAVELGPYTHKPHSASEVFKKRYGDCKDKTTLLLTMLRIAGIEGYPALVSMSNEILDEAIPTIDVFNHVITVVPNGDNAYFWLDATNEVAGFESIPFYPPKKVLIIDNNGGYRFVKSPDANDNKDYIDSLIINNINENGDSIAEMRMTFYGKTSEGYRYGIKYTPPEERIKGFETMGIEVSDLKFSDLSDTEEPFVITVKGTVRNFAQNLDEKSLLLMDKIKIESYKDLSTAKTRKYPISFYPSFMRKSHYVFHLPKGYKIKNLPREYKREDPYRKEIIRYSFSGDILEIYSETKDYKYKIDQSEFETFKKHALEIQKYEASIKGIFFEKE